MDPSNQDRSGLDDVLIGISVVFVAALDAEKSVHVVC